MKLSDDLRKHASADIYTDAPECAAVVAQATEDMERAATIIETAERFMEKASLELKARNKAEETQSGDVECEAEWVLLEDTTVTPALDALERLFISVITRDAIGAPTQTYEGSVDKARAVLEAAGRL